METVQSAEGKRRGCPFINTSQEFIPPYACMMLVAPPDKRPRVGSDDENFIRRKAFGPKFFGYSINNEYGVYVDKCDRWAMIQQDPHRFVFNGDTTVSPGGSGYCTFGEYPARAELMPGMLPVATDDFHYNYYAAVENSWQLQASTHQGAFRFLGKIQERSLGIWVVPNLIENRVYSISGQFTARGAEPATWNIKGLYAATATAGSRFADDYLYRQIFGLPSPLPSTEPIRCLLPGVYVMAYEGIASAWEPADIDTSLPFEVDVENLVSDQFKQEGFASGVLTKVSNGYSSYWPDRLFRGQFAFQVNDEPVEIRLRQTLSNKVGVDGTWRLIYDIRRRNLMQLWYGVPLEYSVLIG